MRRLVAAAFAAGGAAQAAAAAGPPPELVGHAATPLLDGCTHAFLDLGANAGVQTRKLHQPKLYARSSFVPLFQKAGFYKDGAVRCAVGVEPAREYWPRLREIAARFQKRGMRTTFVLGGIGVANGTVGGTGSPYDDRRWSASPPSGGSGGGSGSRQQPGVRVPATAPKGVFDLTPGEDEQMLVDVVTEFADEVVRPAATEADETCAAPEPVLKASLEIGLPILGVPEALGGISEERSAVAGTLVAEALARGDRARAAALLHPAVLAWCEEHGPWRAATAS